MKRLTSMTLDELVALRKKVENIISTRVGEQRKQLMAELDRLRSIASAEGRGAGRVKQVQRKPRYRNPANPSETWAGRGKRPRWLVQALKGGRRKLSEFYVNGGTGAAGATRH